MIEVKNYQLIKISGNKSFKRIINDIKKIDIINSVSIENNNYVMHIEYDNELVSESMLESLEEQIVKIIQVYEKKAQIVKIDTKEVYRKVLYLKGLDCAHCASKLEFLAKKNLNAEKVVVDFATGRFIIETYDKATIDTINLNVLKLARRVDDRITILDSKTAKQRQVITEVVLKPWEIALFIASIVIFVILLVLKQFLNISIYFYLIPYIMVGYPILIRFFKNLYHLQVLDENFLMSIASIGAFFTDHPEEAIMVVALYRIGEFLQNKAVNHSRKSIQELLNFDVKTAKLKMENDVLEVDVESILPGDIVIVHKGESIPVDGKIVAGKTNIDTKNLTGESLLRSVDVGDNVLSGSVNMAKMIEVEATKPYGDSLISKIMDLVENASISKGKTENFITKFAKVYTPLVVLIAVGIITFGFVGDFGRWDYWLYVAMEFLVISCPCALVISIPLCYFSAIGAASKRGILVKGSNYIEALSKIENVVFDKTGTLTKGQFSITKVVPTLEGVTEEQLLRLVVHAEFYSNHPIGISIVESYGRENVFTEIISDFQEIPGGSRVTINGNKILVGNARLLKNNKIEFDVVETDNLVIHVVKNKVYQGYVEIGDIIRAEAYTAIASLHSYSMKCYMLTGDSNEIARSVAKTINIDEYHAELLPNQKVEIVEELKRNSEGKTVFIGDGINDAPVIASADVGIAMGDAGSDATIAISDVVIMGDDLDKIVDVLDISRFTKRKVIQNIVICLFTKFCVMAITLIFAVMSMISSSEPLELPLIVAIFSDVGISLLAILNSLLIMKKYHSKQIGGTNGE